MAIFPEVYDAHVLPGGMLDSHWEPGSVLGRAPPFDVRVRHKVTVLLEVVGRAVVVAVQVLDGQGHVGAAAVVDLVALAVCQTRDEHFENLRRPSVGVEHLDRLPFLAGLPLIGASKTLRHGAKEPGFALLDNDNREPCLAVAVQRFDDLTFGQQGPQR